MPNKKAPMAPVHAPVPGSGIPTKSVSARAWLFSSPNPAAFSRARSRMGLASFCTNDDRSASRIIGMGIMLPATHSPKTFAMGMPIQMPTGTPPRSSTTGIADIVMSVAQSGRPPRRKKLATFCPTWRCTSSSLPATIAFTAAAAGPGASTATASPAARADAVSAANRGLTSGFRQEGCDRQLLVLFSRSKVDSPVRADRSCSCSWASHRSACCCCMWWCEEIRVTEAPPTCRCVGPCGSWRRVGLWELSGEMDDDGVEADRKLGAMLGELRKAAAIANWPTHNA